MFSCSFPLILRCSTKYCFKSSQMSILARNCARLSSLPLKFYRSPGSTISTSNVSKRFRFLATAFVESLISQPDYSNSLLFGSLLASFSWFSTLPVCSLSNANLSISFLCVKGLGDLHLNVSLLWPENHLYKNHLVCLLKL